jgi:hypothetical protein
VPTARPLFEEVQVVVGPSVLVRLQRTVFPRLKVTVPVGAGLLLLTRTVSGKG